MSLWIPVGKIPSFQFYPGDWLKEPCLRSVSLAAKGLWIDMLCLMHESDRRGFLEVNGKPVTTEQLSRMAGCSVSDASRHLRELDDSGVFSRTEAQTIYSRRMVRDEAERGIWRNQKRNQRTRPPDVHPLSAGCPPPSSSSPSSSSSEKDTPQPPGRGATVGRVDRKLPNAAEIANAANLPADWHCTPDEGVRAALARWGAWQWDCSKRWSLGACNALVLEAMRHGWSESKFAVCIDASIGNGWRTVRDPDVGMNGQAKPDPAADREADRKANREAFQQAVAERERRNKR